MKKKSVEKLINKIDIDNNFDKLNNQINYDKYIKENKKEKAIHRPIVKIAIVVGAVYAAFLLVVGVDYASCSSYNKKVLEKHANMYSLDNTSIYSLNSKNDYNEYVNRNYEFKTPFIESLFDIFSTKNFPTNDSEIMNDNGVVNEDVFWEDDAEVSPEAPGDTANSGVSGETSIGTNIQTEGLDEADYSKCDGKYIYSLSYDFFEIYDLNGTTLVSNQLNYNYHELYLYENSVILLGNSQTDIYSFDGSKITLQNSFKYLGYTTSRLYKDTLYLITWDAYDENTETYENLYYDGCTQGKNIYTIVKYDLKTHTYDSVRNLNRGVVTLYASDKHFYLATSVYYYEKDVTYATVSYKPVTVVSIFDFDLNAIGAVRVLGNILNQFSMDEYNNYFRVVSTNTSVEEKGRLNAISIYDLSTLERVGYLDTDIGLNRQVVKSVTYDATTCYVVTYENTDPLYEIDLSDVTSPKIVSIYKAPGYSNYLHKFEINGQKYLFGIGYDDDRWTRKISIYIDNGQETIQIGKDFKIGEYNYNEIDLLVSPYLNDIAFNNHKALFIYNDGSDLFLGLKVTPLDYYIFKVDVDSENVVSIYKHIEFEKEFEQARCYLVDGKIYITGYKELHVESFR